MRTWQPLPIRVSTSATIGLSRKSSVPALKARPTTPTRRFRVWQHGLDTADESALVGGQNGASSGVGTSAMRAA